MAIKRVVAAATGLIIAATLGVALAEGPDTSSSTTTTTTTTTTKPKVDCGEVVKKINAGEHYRDIAGEMGITYGQVKRCKRKAKKLAPGTPAADPAMNHKGPF